MSQSTPKKLLINGLKLAVSAALISYLAWRAVGDAQFQQLAQGPKDWPLLLLAVPICFFAVTVTILRWHLLIWALGLKFTVRETLRAGFLAYLANFLPLGLVAGDSLKAVMLIHRNPNRKTEAVAAVLVDRTLGLYALLLLAAVASLFLSSEQLTRLAEADRLFITRLSWALRAASVLSTLGLIVMLIPGVTQSRWWDLLEHLPLVGPVLHKLVGAMRAYRRRVELLATAVGVSLIVHLMYVLSVVVMSNSIGIAPEHRPAWASIFVIVPPTMIAGALPIGIYEVTITLLFAAVSPPGAPPNMGLLIGLAYRLIQLAIASIGVVYWLAGRSEVREFMHEAEESPPEEELGGEESSSAVPA
jgi:uncharacterized protein (TIRG00374 family)